MDLGKTQAEWTQLFKELGLLLAPLKLLTDVERKFNERRGRIQIVEENDVNGFTSGWTLAGAQLGVNTDADGRLYVRITDENPAPGSALVEVYKAAGGGAGNKVATGSGANGSTVTLAAANSSGLTGTVAIGTVTASESDDLHRLLVFPDFPLRARVVFDNTAPEHSATVAAYLSACRITEAAIKTAKAAWLAVVETWVRTRAAVFNAASTEGDALINLEVIDDDGRIESDYTGLLELVRDNMEDETTGGEQDVVKNVVAAGSPAYDADNQGIGVLGSIVMEEWAAPGTITLACVDATIGAEQFSVTQRDSQTGESRTAKSRLQAKKAYADPIIGIRTMQLTRTYSKTGDGTNLHFGAAATHALDGESADNTDDGVIYLKVTGSTGAWVIHGYRSSSYGASEEVFQGVAGAAGATVAISEVNGSGFSGTVTIGSAPVDTSTASLSLNPFRTQNTAGVPDKITVGITVTSTGEFQRRIKEAFGYWLNSDTSGAESIDDSFVSAGTFPAYEVADA